MAYRAAKRSGPLGARGLESAGFCVFLSSVFFFFGLDRASPPPSPSAQWRAPCVLSTSSSILLSPKESYNPLEICRAQEDDFFRQPRSLPFLRMRLQTTTGSVHKSENRSDRRICPFGSEKTSIQGDLGVEGTREHETRSVQDHKHDDDDQQQQRTQPTRRAPISRGAHRGERLPSRSLPRRAKRALRDQTDSRVWAFSCPRAQVRGTKWHEVEAEVS